MSDLLGRRQELARDIDDEPTGGFIDDDGLLTLARLRIRAQLRNDR